MKRQLSIAAVAAITLVGCGPMDELEVDGTTGVWVAAMYAPETVASTQDPEPIKGGQGSLVQLEAIVNGTATVQGVVLPGSAVASTQDPEPIKGRQGSPKDPRDRTMAPGAATNSSEEPDTRGGTVASTQDPEPIRPLWFLYLPNQGGDKK